MATDFKLTPEEQQSIEDRRALVSGAIGAGRGALKLGAAAADIGTLPIRAGMGAVNTLLRVPNALGMKIPYIPEQAFGGSSSSMTPYMDKLRAMYPEEPSRVPSSVPVRAPTNELADPTAGIGDTSALGFGATPNTVAKVVPPATNFTAADIVGNRVPVSGTGAFMNSRGEVTNLDTRVAAPTTTPEYRARTPLGMYFGATRGLQQKTGEAVQQQASNKLLMEALLKGPTAAHANAQSQKENMSAQIAARIADPATPEAERERLKSAAGALYGRFETTSASVPQGYMGDFKGNVPVVTTRGAGVGAVKLVTPTQMATEQTVKDTLAAHPEFKGSRTEAIKALKATGRYSTDGLQ